MVVTPNSVTAVDMERGSDNTQSGRSVGEDMASKFVRGPVRDANADLANAKVESSDHQDVGFIQGIVVGQDGALSYLLATNNGNDIAVNPKAISLNYNDNSGKWDATVDATARQIDSAPQVQENQNNSE